MKIAEGYVKCQLKAILPVQNLDESLLSGNSDLDNSIHRLSHSASRDKRATTFKMIHGDLIKGVV